MTFWAFFGFFEQSASVRHLIPNEIRIVLIQNLLRATIVVLMMTYNGEGTLLGDKKIL